MLHLLADVSLNHHLLTACHRNGANLDILSASKARIEGMNNKALLAFAAEQDRILITHDILTLTRDFYEYLATGAFSPGVFLLDSTTPISEAATWLALASAATEPEHWDNLIVEIPFLRLIELPLPASQQLPRIEHHES